MKLTLVIATALTTLLGHQSWCLAAPTYRGLSSFNYYDPFYSSYYGGIGPGAYGYSSAQGGAFAASRPGYAFAAAGDNFDNVAISSGGFYGPGFGGSAFAFGGGGIGGF